MRSSLGILVLAAMACFGCDKLKKKADEAAAAASASASAAAAGSGAAPEAKAASNAGGAAAARTIDGVGDVPPWAPDTKLAKCGLSADVKAKTKAIEKGDDAAIASGKTDIAALAHDLGADTCANTKKHLAQALNDGGFKKYQAKKYDEANRYWRDALVVRPANVISRYNLACGLALAGKPKDAVAEIDEIARAAREEDATASNFLEKAKSDADLASIRDDAEFKEALKASTAHLVGPRSEPETSTKAVPLLPADFKRPGDKPALQKVWTWRPDASTELLVATVIDDPAKAGKPKGDVNDDYGAIAVFKRSGDALTLLLAHKTGESPPSVASGKGGTVAYSFDEPCGTLGGKLKWNGKSVEIHEKKCEDL